MRTIRERKSWVALLAILVLFTACKGDSPTAPAPGGGTPGGSTPPANVVIALTASKTDPLVDSSVTITATVTLSGAPVANGTAVEFVSSAGLIDGAAAATIKTTTNGIATVTLTSSAAGKIVVGATVNNVSKSVEVTFLAKPTTENPPVLTPTITSVTPAIGRPAGGEIIKITGTNFKTPLKVLFDLGGIAPVEVFVASSTDKLLEVITPAVDLGAGQQKTASIIIITGAGTSAEDRVEAADAFTFRNEQLTPVVSSLSPNSGPVGGGTRVTIFGEGFQAPLQVMFGSIPGNIWTEAQIISIKYNEIIALTPLASATAPSGSGTVTGPVDLRIVNIASNTSVEVDNSFRYVAAITITAIGPNEGPYTGGTRVSIDGTGFVGPVTVSIGGRVAQPISVSGTKIIAITDALEITSCADSGGAVVVTNITNGDSASGPSFTYKVPKPLISAISPAVVTAGGNVQITVQNAQPGVNRISLGDRELFPTGAVFSDDGSAVFTVAVPTNFEFQTEACTDLGVVGVQEVSLIVDVKYTNLETTCTNTLADGLEIEPTDTSCQLPPVQDAAISPVTPPCINMGNVTAAGTATGTTNFTISNFGGQPLVISSAVVSSTTNTTTVTVSPPSGSVAAGGSQVFTVTADPAAAAAFGGTITISTNDPDEPTFTFCFDGTGL